MALRTHGLPESKLVNVASEHGAGGEDGGVGGGHDGGGDSTQTEERDSRRAEVLEHDGQNHV